MPADSREIYQEGLVIPPVRLVREGELSGELLELIEANVRTPAVRRGDLRAQLASVRLADRRCGELIEHRGERLFAAALNAVIAYAERRTREALGAIGDGRFVAESEIEGDGVEDRDIPLKVAVTIAGQEIEVDFDGTSGQVAGNVNCPLSVTRSACYFALRVMLPKDIPANAGTFAPMGIRAPAGSLVNARRPAAVVGGNVETSQRVADTVLQALGQALDLPAQGQGTMNNVVIGGANWTYYETIGGGQGGSASADGDSGVHVGMTNTLNTPIEALELEYPMRVERYQLAYGTGGRGRHPGGDGIERAVRVLEPASLSLLTDRRRHRPQGARGGGPGRAGENRIDQRPLGPKAARELAGGELVWVRTPGGGGWGPVSSRPRRPLPAR
jgi:N-methylhydantoinase B